MAPLGLIVLDISATAVDIANRTVLYGLDAAVRTRLNAVYQVAMFLGGAVMSVLVGVCWSWGGWFALCALGMVPIVIAFIASLPRAAADGSSTVSASRSGRP